MWFSTNTFTVKCLLKLLWSPVYYLSQNILTILHKNYLKISLSYINRCPITLVAGISNVDNKYEKIFWLYSTKATTKVCLYYISTCHYYNFLSM